ncbi:MAG: DUF4926 domain-containing protein [Chloroflexi bacterium]|nr:DUF4926 domain-containing protein [Chloroflexota bacterium]
MSDQIALLEVIVATISAPADGVLAGDIGTVVEIYTVPTRAYDVEFVNPDGSTRALLTLAPEQVRRLSATDVMTTRPMALAV